MKRVLIIAHSFPPASGPGVQRTSKFVKYLRSFGWEPVVLTRDDKGLVLKDESLFKDIPEGVRVIRLKAWDFTSLKGIMSLPGKFISRKLMIPDSERLWQTFGNKKAAEVVKKEDIDLVYTTSLPYSSHLMGLYLKKIFPGLPWVADFRDEWTNNPYILDNPYNPVRMSIEKGMEKEVLKTADCLIANTPVMHRNFINNNPSLDLAEKFYTISNGYDPDDFNSLQAVHPDNERFTITYTGSLYGRRKPDIFLEALGQLAGEGGIERDKIHVKLIGNYKVQQLEQLLEKHGVKDLVQILPYMKHDECVRNMMASDCLLLIEGAGPGAEAFYTGKVFEYLTTNKPILAVIPEKGAAAQVIKDTHTGLISDCTDVKGTKENIQKLYKCWLSGNTATDPDNRKIEKYSRKALTGELTKVFAKAMQKAGDKSI